MITPSFYSNVSMEPEGLGLAGNYVLFHGDPLDDRGRLAIGFGGASIRRVLVEYDIETMSIALDGKSIEADKCSELFAEYSNEPVVVIEATTLGFAELFSIIRALIDNGAKRLEVVYIEPKDYKKGTGDQYALSHRIKGYVPIPKSIVDLTDDDLEAGVFFLGFESDRLERALEEHQMIATKDIKVVFGIPAFQPGWELNSIVPHLKRLSEQGQIGISYCSANDPEAAFECLESTRSALGAGKRMFIAPIGTKPCGIASAVFVSVYPDQVGLLFDHPKRKENRSEGSNVWHRYSIILEG